MENKDIVVIFNQKSLILDVQATNTNGYYNEALLGDFKKDPYRTLFYLGFEDKNPDMSISLSFIHSICLKFTNALSQDSDIEITKIVKMPEEEFFSSILISSPFVIGFENLSIEWFVDLWKGLSSVFEDEISNWESSVSSFLNTYNSKLNAAGRVFFHLVENKSTDYPFAFLATYSIKSSEKKKATHVPLKNALLEYKDNQALLLKLLSTVSRAADKSDFISELIESGELFSPLQLDVKEAYTFLKEIPLYEESGIMCRMPDWWKKKNSSLKMSVSIGAKEPSSLGFDALVSCCPNLSLDGEDISKEEIEALMAQASGLYFLKGKWIEVDHEKLKLVLEAYNKVNGIEDITLAEAMRIELGVSNGVTSDLDDAVEVTNGEWLRSVKNKLVNPKLISDIDSGFGFKATLRHYQQLGFNWLASMNEMGFGALLADDMGLGKTVQILAFLNYLKNKGDFRGLLVIPASLIGNWQKEIDKFAPEIMYSILHSKNTIIDDKTQLFITTYGMVSRIEELARYKWDLLILDEAQAIKNTSTKQTKIVKQLNATFKIAMTGTPIENKLSDLWSLFDFLNKGLLGSAKEFSDYAKNIKESGSYSKLRNVVSPFVLRRLKTDKTIISDLPDKIELKAYTSLTNKQIVLYQKLVKELEKSLENTEGLVRKGLVLSSIMKFKQICNHSDQYLGQADYKLSGSGKFEKLQEICETIYEKRERVLVFTQFREITEPIAEFLSAIFERDGLVLHGGTTIKKRDEMVDEFNGDEYVPFMVLSLKAGGVGLNLTSANHVIHFDRWWNPSVENQATDRAFRIGQTKNVMVHKFITTGTIEEKIDSMIEEKQKLSGDIIASTGENWITEMNNDELIKLFTLEV
jgi:non-specific serine/threonine protein kinase